jgi:hypothetical protein
MAFSGRGMLPEHEHGFSTFLVQLLEEYKRSLVQTQAALLVPVDDVQGILPPICCNVVLLQGNGQDFVAGIVDGYAEGFEYLDLWVCRWCRCRGRGSV